MEQLIIGFILLVTGLVFYGAFDMLRQINRMKD